MARRKKKKKSSSEQRFLPKKPKAFNPVFREKVAIKETGVPIVKGHEETGEDGGVTEPTRDTQMFLEAMSDVEPLDFGKNRITRTPDMHIRPAHSAPDDELEGLAYLSDLISGTADMDITFSDEYIEGSVNGVSRKLMQRLKKGQFPIQDHVDLHGLTKQGAEIKVRDFLLQSARLGLRCVLIIHGRGLNSENNIPVLKERLPVWLNRGPAKKIVLAFSTARPYDGGTGAVYVLLRRPRAGI